ncbi:MAG: DEAD/DEAH box helicase [Candidatus Kariarchaeaceae archaeon]
MKKSYTALVKEGKIFLNEPTDLPEGTKVQLFEERVSHTLIEQIPSRETTAEPIPIIKETTEAVVTLLQFDKFGLHESLNQAIEKVGYTTPTLIQNQAIQSVLDKKDVLGIAKTGSGKTAAFALPILNNLLQLKREPKKQPKVLIVTPTRELAIQIGVSFDTYGRYAPLRQVTIFGGVSQKHQVDQLKNVKPQILVATPGRLLDLINQRIVTLDFVQTLILDEADRMLDMGFIPDIKRIVNKIPERDQTLLFSATMPKEILNLAKLFLKEDFVHVTGDQQSIPIEKIKQEIYFVEKKDKLALLENMLSHDNISRALIFSRTKHGADKLVRKLKRQAYTIEAMHGNKSQPARQRALGNFKNNKTQILVATDLAARGLDVDDISHVINYDLPMEPETYMHRIGRTARAGKSGIAISFCANEERKYFAMIEQLLGFHIPRALDNPVQSVNEEPLPTQFRKKKIGKTKSIRNKPRKRTRKRSSYKLKNTS